MNVQDFDFELPSHLIAQYPPKERAASRLMKVDADSGDISHLGFGDLIQFIEPGDVLILNDTKVIPARCFGHKMTGGKVECLIERLLSDTQLWVHFKSSKSLKPGQTLLFDHDIVLRVLERSAKGWLVELAGGIKVDEFIKRCGEIPLPPYMKRAPEEIDVERYQTVFAKHEGAVAAPTAGLHFDKVLLDSLDKKGVKIGYVTLHVGAGTFLPLRHEHVTDNELHSERMAISAETCEMINHAKSQNKRVIAVGTTSVRCLETAAMKSTPRGIQTYQGETSIFIYPGYSFKCVDALITNFHLPKTSLLMLVSAMIGKDKMLRAYQAAIDEEYRFFSYGDAMFIC